MRAWYLHTAALPVLASIRANPPRLEERSKSYVQTRDEWAVYVGDRVDRLNAIYTAAFERAMDAKPYDPRKVRAVAKHSVQDVIAAVLGVYIPGIHFTTDLPRLAGIRDEVEAALAASARGIAA